MVKGWFRFFGFPDELLLDAEGAMKGFQFEILCAQAGIRVRFVPADAHWQLGKAERHGQAAKWIMARLVNQFAPTTVPEMEMLAAMTCQSKNSLARKAGASPSQWVFGRNPKIPASLLSEHDAIEAKQVIEDSEKLRRIEEIRHAALREYLDYEHNEALRRAILRKQRPWRGPLEVGQKIAYYRQRNQLDGEGTNEGYRQGLIIGLDPGPSGSVWVRNNRGRIVQVAREQVRGVEGEELWSPSNEDLKMLRSAEQDLSQKHARAFQHEGPAPRLEDDCLILDAAGREVRGDPPEPPVPLALPPPPSPSIPEPEEKELQPVLREPPASRQSEGVGDHLAPLPEPPVPKRLRFDAGNRQTWFLDPDGRPTVVAENATEFAALPDDFVAQDYKYRTSWTFQDGRWQKIEDQVPWRKKTGPEDTLPHGQVEKLVTTYSPNINRGRMPSIDSLSEMRGQKREGAPLDPDIAAEQDRQAVDQPGTTDTTTTEQPLTAELTTSLNQALTTSTIDYCANCGCSQWQVLSDGKIKCIRCMAMVRTNDPFQVTAWFDEVEEREAYALLQQQGDLVLADKETAMQLPLNDVLDELHQNESYLLEVGQVHQTLPEQHSSSLWSSAHKIKGQWQWKHIFENIDVDADTAVETFDLEDNAAPKNDQVPEEIFVKENDSDLPKEYDNNTKRIYIQHINRCGKSRPRRIGRSRWFRKFGRHCNYLLGWDGTPPELQPFFQYDSFAQVLHACSQALASDLTSTSDLDLLREAELQKQEGNPTWSARMRGPKSPSVHNTSAYDNVILGPDVSSGEEGDVPEDGGGRAAKQALKRETPWRSIPAEDIPAFVEAMQNEWSEWEKWSSCTPVHMKKGDVDEKLILKSRVCYRWKPIDGGKRFKPKARIVVAGFADPHLPLLSRDAPVLARTTLVLIVQWAATFNVSLWNGDCKSAFLQGEPDTERPVCIYMKPPQDDIARAAVPDWEDTNLYYQLTAPVYGQANAPRRWYLHVLRVLTELGWAQHTLDPCCFLQKRDGQVIAVLGVHVDDIVVACLPGAEEHLEALRGAFAWGSEWEKDNFIFVGRRIQRHEDGSYTMDQAHYVNEVSLTKIQHNLEDKLSEHPELITEFRSGIGSLQWLAGTPRGDLSADVSLLQKPPKDLLVGDLKEINRVLKYTRATANSHFRVQPIPVSDLMFIAYGDAGWANAPGNKSQGGLVVVASSKKALSETCKASLLEWKSYRHQRTLRSTLAAEAASLDRAHDTGTFMSCVFGEMVDAEYKASSGQTPFQVTPVTDARSLWDAIHRLSTTFSEKRVEIDVANLRSCCRGLPTEFQLADALTKRCSKLRDQFRKWAMDPQVTLVESRSAEDGTDNQSWRNCAKPKERLTSDKFQCELTFAQSSMSG